MLNEMRSDEVLLAVLSKEGGTILRNIFLLEGDSARLL